MSQNLPYASPPAAPSTHTSQLKVYLERNRAELLKLLDSKEQAGSAFAREHAEIMDRLLRALFEAGTAASARACGDVPVLLGAVGGYGRRRLGWKSDLDVRLVTPATPEAIQPLAEAILYPLWDAGVSIGHQVMSIPAAIADAEHDLPTATALLDFRMLGGDADLGTALRGRAFDGIFAPANLPRFLHRLEAEAGSRHQRLGDSIYLLEPDIKNGAGGLRDLDIALWAARARWKVEELRDLAKLGVLLPREVAEITRAEDFLWQVRNRLHRNSGRRSDRLTFPEQEVLAEAMGYRARIGADQGASAAQTAGAMAEAFMSDYYRHARVITRSREHLLARAMPPQLGRSRHRIHDLGRGLFQAEGYVAFADERALASDPALAMRVYATAVERELAVQPETRNAIARETSDERFCAALRRSAEAAKLFVSLSCHCERTRFRRGSILAELHDVGLLTALVPEFAPVVGRVHHDVYHVYTVDAHSIAALDHLRALCRGDVPEQGLASELAVQLAPNEALFLATLLHDIGKDAGGKGHSHRGAELARGVLTRLGLGAEAVEAACRLIEQHLLMYHVAACRDLEDPATIAEFVRDVGGQDGLRDLYLLTVADLSTTSPTSMTQWKAGMLDALYQAAFAWLDRGGTGAEPQRVARVREQVAACWDLALDPGFLREFLDTMPERYLLSNTPAEIAAHARCALSGRGAGVRAALVPSRHADVAELCVVTEHAIDEDAGLCVVAGDRPGLLAAIAAALAASRLEIHAAQIHSRVLPGGAVQAVDVFWVRDPIEGVAGVEQILPKLQRDLRAVIDGAVSPEELLQCRRVSRWSERPHPPVATEIAIDQISSPQHTVIEVVSKDRPGLLFRLAQTLHEQGLSIALAKINTEGTRVGDVFYVTQADGSKLESPARAEAVRQALLTALAPRASGS